MCLITSSPVIQQSSVDIVAYKVCIFENDCYKLISNNEALEFGKLYINNDSLVMLDNISTLTIFSGFFHLFKHKIDAESACDIISEKIEKECRVIKTVVPANTEFMIGVTFWGTDLLTPKGSIAAKQVIYNKV
jgi:hypothetical protein